jgi:hypothetical protein
MVNAKQAIGMLSNAVDGSIIMSRQNMHAPFVSAAQQEDMTYERLLPRLIHMPLKNAEANISPNNRLGTTGVATVVVETIHVAHCFCGDGHNGHTR